MDTTRLSTFLPYIAKDKDKKENSIRHPEIVRMVRKGYKKKKRETEEY